jgi:hypothetical protein
VKVIKHDRIVRPGTLTLGFNPLIVWLSKTVELRIERSDRLGAVAEALAAWWPVSAREARRIVGYWFTLGERRATGDPGTGWSAREMADPSPERRYLRIAAAAQQSRGSRGGPRRRGKSRRRRRP